MFILLVALAALVTAIIRGGHLANFAQVRLRYFPALFVPLVVQLVIFSPLAAFMPASLTAIPLAHVVSLLMAALVVCFNLNLPGFKLLLVGLLSNLAAIVVNGGYMPVSTAAREAAGLPALTSAHNNIQVLTDATPLWFLADIFPIPSGIPFANVFSIGDVLIAVGIFVFVHRTLVHPALPQAGATR